MIHERMEGFIISISQAGLSWWIPLFLWFRGRIILGRRYFWAPLLESEAGGWSSTGNLARPQLRLAWTQFVDWVSLGYVQQVLNDLPDMVDEILQNIHHIWRDVVEWDGRVAAAGSSVCLAEENVNRQTSIILKFFFHLSVFAVCFVATIFLPVLWWDQLKNFRLKKELLESLTWNDVLPWIPDHEPSSSSWVPWVANAHIQFGQALT